MLKSKISIFYFLYGFCYITPNKKDADCSAPSHLSINLSYPDYGGAQFNQGV